MNDEQFEPATAEFETVIAQAPAAAEGHFGLGRALAGLRRIPEAVEALTEAVRLDPREARYSHYLG